VTLRARWVTLRSSPPTSSRSDAAAGGKLRFRRASLTLSADADILSASAGEVTQCAVCVAQWAAHRTAVVAIAQVRTQQQLGSGLIGFRRTQRPRALSQPSLVPPPHDRVRSRGPRASLGLCDSGSGWG
jgi:hypothetical protein